MSEHLVTVEWQREQQSFIDNKYSRGHLWHFDGGATVAASSSPSVVPLPYSVAENVDPEEAFAASLSSCHMLFFLSVAAAKKICVDRYIDHAVAVMGADEKGRQVVNKVILRPEVTVEGSALTRQQLEKIHHKAHELCFLANSVHCEIIIEIQ